VEALKNQGPGHALDSSLDNFAIPSLAGVKPGLLNNGVGRTVQFSDQQAVYCLPFDANYSSSL
jgi:hypothetical protein